MVIERGNDTAFIVDAVPSDEPTPSPQALAFARQIESKERTLDSHDLFAILGVKRDATTAEINAAYDLLNRWFGLERLAELGLSHLQAPLVRVRDHLRQAHAVLAHEALRMSYLRALFGTPPSVPASNSVEPVAEPVPPSEAATVVERRPRRKLRSAA
jgi:preprotein translocase subunit Sec63